MHSIKILHLKNSSGIVRNFFIMIPSFNLYSWKENSLYTVTKKLYVCRYLSAVKPLVASQRLYFSGGGGFHALEDIALLQIPV
jgi:hypothetical protein